MAESSSSSSGGWEFIGKDGKRAESFDDNQSETSESSIEVVSMDTTDLLSLESVRTPVLPSDSSGPFLVLRLRSKEKESVTESDESDDHQTKDQGIMKRRRKSKPRSLRSQELTLSSDLSTPSEEERDFVAIPDPQKESGESVLNTQEQDLVELEEEEIQNSLQAVNNGSVQGFHVIEAPLMEDQEPAVPSPFDENEGVVPGTGEEENFMFLGVPQDDPDTESSPEVEDEQDDRIESDRSDDRHSDDFSTFSNVDISDLMAENNLIRQYVFRPNPSVNVTLNFVMVVVISVALGLGIGHAIGSAKERFSNLSIREMSLNMDGDGDCPFDAEDVEKLTAENLGLKEEANKAQNEVVDLRSEVMKLRYSSAVSSAEEEKRLTLRKNRELKLEVNMLQHENEDLKKLVGSLKYGSHPGNSEGGCPKKGPDNQLQEQTRSSTSIHDDDDGEERESSNENLKELKEDENLDDRTDGHMLVKRKHVSIINVVYPASDIQNINSGDDSDFDIDSDEEDENDIDSFVEVEYEENENVKGREDMPDGVGKIEREREFFPCSSRVNNVEKQGDVSTEDSETETESRHSDEIESVAKVEDVAENDEEAQKYPMEEDVEILDEDLGDEVAEDEEVSNTSTENIPSPEDEPIKGSPDDGKREENAKREGGSSKKTDWRETMHKILNKTKASVSDVTQQIQDTWKQVKNISEDLWKKNEPVFTKFKTNLVLHVGEAAQKISAKLQEETKNWFRKKARKHEDYPKHRQNDDYYPEKEQRSKHYHWRNHEDHYPKHRQNDDMYKERRNNRDSIHFKARTRRRSFKEERENHKPWRKHHRKAEKYERKRAKKFQKMKRRFEKMHEYEFCKMNMKKRQKFFDILEAFDEKFQADKMPDPDQMWYSCQWDWWWNAISFHIHFMLMDPKCQGALLPWQEGILAAGRWECPGFPQNLRQQNQQVFQFQEYGHDEDDDLDEDDEIDEKGFKNVPYFDESEILQKSNYTEEFKGCDPTKGICDFNKNDSWYLKKMKFRQYQRFADAKEKGKTEWMFARANHRQHERERTDDSQVFHRFYECK